MTVRATDVEVARSEFSHIKTLNARKCLSTKKTIIVLGNARGGTSALAGALRELGVVMPHAGSFTHEWSPICYRKNTVDLAPTVRKLDEYNRLFEIWGWKYPQDAFALDVIQAHIRNPILVIIFRNFLDVCVSTEKHEEVPWEASVKNHADVVSQLSTIITYSSLPLTVLSYERLLAKPTAVLEELNNWLCLHANSEAMIKASKFIDVAAGYSCVSFAPHSVALAEDELARDRGDTQNSGVSAEDQWAKDHLDIQVGLYTGAINRLRASISALEADISIAVRIKSEMMTSLRETIKANEARFSDAVKGTMLDFTAFLPADAFLAVALSRPQKNTGEPTDIEDFKQALSEGWSRDHAVRSTRSLGVGERGLIAGNSEQDASLLLLRAAYDKIRLEHNDTCWRRIALQRDMDCLQEKLSLIKGVLGANAVPEVPTS
jgi:hypothetical protein